VSPFAQPEIAFAWIVGMAVTDRHLYVADSVNRRVLRVKLDYAVEETAAVP
jgi:sugar lactone lactonase YvrE